MLILKILVKIIGKSFFRTVSAEHKKFISTKEASSIVGRTSDYIGRLAREGKIPASRIGRSWVVEKKALLEFFDIKEAAKEIKRETLSKERKVEYKKIQAPKTQAEFKTTFTKTFDRIPFENAAALTLTILVVFGGYSLAGATGLSSIPATIASIIHEKASDVHRVFARAERHPNFARANYVVGQSQISNADELRVETRNIFAEGLAGLHSFGDRYGYQGAQRNFASTYVPSRSLNLPGSEDIWNGYKAIGEGVTEMAHTSTEAYTNFVKFLGKKSLSNALAVRDLSQMASSNLLASYEAGIEKFVSLAKEIPAAQAGLIYSFVDGSFAVADTLASVPYNAGGLILSSAQSIPEANIKIGNSIREESPKLGRAIIGGYVDFIYNFVDSTYALTDTYKEAIELTGDGIGSSYAYARFEMPTIALSGADSALDFSTDKIGDLTESAGEYIAANFLIPVVKTAIAVPENIGSRFEIAGSSLAENTTEKVEEAQANVIGGVAGGVRDIFDRIFGHKKDPVLLVNPGPAQTNVVIKEDEPAAPVYIAPRNVTQNFFAATDVNKLYVDSSITALHAALSAEIQKLTSLNRNQIVQNIETIQWVNKIEDISGTIIRDGEFLSGIIRDSEITGSTFQGSSVNADTGTFDTLNAATTTITGPLSAPSISISGAVTLATTTLTGPLSGTTATLTSATTTNFFTTNASSTNATSTNFFANNASTTNATSTNLFSNNSVITNATSTNFYATALEAITATLTNLTVTNATTTNATTTNLAISGLTAGSIPFIGTGGLIVEDNSNFFFDNANDRLGVGTATPATSIDINATDAIRIPVGTSAQRPSTSLTGQIRYNSTTAQYEGYNGSNWLGLGGVIDIDQDTYVTAEESSDEDYLRLYTAGSERLTIDNSGKVGIGTTSPQELLHVHGGNVAIENNYGLRFRTADDTTTAGYIKAETNNSLTISNAYQALNVETSGAYPVTLGTSDTERLRITSDGDVGIGTTSPYAKLSVVGQAVAEYFTATSTTLVSTLPELTSTNATTTGTFSAVSGGAQAAGITVNADGYVGINNTSPAFPLDVKVSASKPAIIRADTEPRLRFVANGTNTGLLNAYTGDSFRVYSSSGLPLYLGYNETTQFAFSSGQVDSSVAIIPTANATYDLGSPSFYWDDAYLDSATINNLSAASTSIAGTNNASFSINSDNATSDAEDASLIFYRGVVVPNAVITWDSSEDRFDFNQNVFIQNDNGSTATSTVAIRAASSQTGNLFSVQDSAGAELANFNVSGYFGLGSTTPYARLSVGTGTPDSLTAGSLYNSGYVSGDLEVDGTIYGTVSGAITPAGFTEGSVVFAGSGGTLSQDNDNFFWDDSSNRLGIGTSSPYAKLSVVGQAVAEYFTATSTTLASTFPNFTSTNGTSTQFAIGSLTSGRIPYATTGGRLIDDADLTFDGSRLTTTNFVATNGTTTNATSTNLSVSGSLNLSGLTASRALFVDSNNNVGTSAASSVLASSLTDETGTGNVVFSASPTLTGTAVLANYEATNGTTTNATSTSFFTSTFGLGSGNYFTSLLGNGLVNSSGALSVSTTSLASGFFQNGGNSFGAAAVLGTNDSNTLAFETGGTTRVTIDTSGNVGIGTSSPSYPLDVNGDFRVGEAGQTDVFFVDATNKKVAVGGDNASPALNSTFSVINGAVGESTYLDVLNSNTSQFIKAGINSNQAQIGYDNADTFAIGEFDDTSDTTIDVKFAIDTSGNVGIGTTSPGYLLDVDGDFRVGEAGSATAFFVDATNGQAGIGTTPASSRQLHTQTSGVAVLEIESTGNQAGLQIDNDTATWDIYMPSGSSDLRFYDSGDRITFQAGGNVGIGTSTPQNVLHVNAGGAAIKLSDNSGTGDGALTYFQFADQNGTQTGYFGDVSASNGDIALQADSGDIVFRPGASEAVRILENGNVGIGTTSPTSKLTIYSTGGSDTFESYVSAQYDSSSDTYRTGLFKTGVTNSAPDVRIVDADNSATRAALQIQGNGGSTEVAFFGSNGRVGIGTTSPDEILTLESTGPKIRFNDSNATNDPYVLINGSSGELVFSTDPGNVNTSSDIVFEADGSEIVRFVDSGNVGIGTTSPQTKFAISDSSNVELRLHKESNEYWDIGAGSNELFVQADDSTLFTILDSGNVGIGAASPAQLLELEANNARIRIDDAGGTQGLLAGLLSGGQGFIQLDDGAGATEIIFRADGGASYINTGGNVGIGTTSPLGNLHVTAGGSGTVYQPLGNELTVEDDADVGIALQHPTANKGYLYFSTPLDGDSAYIEHDGTNRYLALGTVGAERIRIDNSGNVGVGTTSPGYPLDVNGDFRVGEAGNATALFVDATNSQLGIGAAPARELHISASVPRFRLEDTDGGYFDFSGSGGHGTISADVGNTQGGSRLAFEIDTVEVVRITAAGSVGIGETSPGSKLAVSGNATIGSGYDTTAAPTNGLIVEGSVGIGSDSPGSTQRLLVEYTPTGTFTETANTAYNHLTVRGNNNGYAGLTIASPNSGAEVGAIAFADPKHASAGLIQYDHTSNDLSFFASTTARLYIDGNDGYVGIGDTTPGAMLDIDDNASTGTGLRVYGGGSGGPLATFVRDVGSTGIIQINSSGGDPQIYFDNETADGDWAIGNDSATDDLYFSTNTTIGTNDRVVFTQEGNVGIGQTAPSAKLDIVGDGTNYGLEVNNTSTGDGINIALPGSTGSNALIASSGGSLTHNFFIDSSGRGSLILYDAGTARSQIAVGGGAHTYFTESNVGIGTTSPQYQLDVYGNGGTGIGIGDIGRKKTITASSSVSPYDVLTLTSNGSAGTWRGAVDLDVSYNGGSAFTGLRVVANTDGTTANVGIGTTSPAYQLEIHSGAGQKDIYVDASSHPTIGTNFGSGASIELYNGSTGNTTFSNGFNGNWVFSGTGNVGIGDTSPVSKIEIKTTNALGSSFENSTNGEGIRITQTDYSAGNYVSLIESAYDDIIEAPNVRIAAMFDGGGSNLAIGTSNSYGSGITNTALWIDSIGRLGVGTTSEIAHFAVDASTISGEGYRSTAHIENDAYESVLTLRGTGSGYLNAGINLIASSGTDVRALGTLAYDQTGDNVWFWGRPYNGSDAFVINRRSTAGYNTDVSDPTDGDVTNAFYIASDGDIGIGTSSPAFSAYQTTIVGNLGLSAGTGSTDANYIQVRNANNITQFGTESASGNSILTGGTANATVFGSNGAHPVHFGTSNTVRATIDSSGNVGIGTTTPGEKLHVSQGKIKLDNNFAIVSNDASGNAVEIMKVTTGDVLQYIAPGGSGDIQFLTNFGSNSFWFDSSGNVGIGTTTPEQKLHMVSDGEASFILLDSFGVNNQIRGRTAGGTLSSPSATPDNTILFAFSANGHDGSDFTAARGLASFESEEAFTGSAQGVRFTIDTTEAGTTSRTEKLRITGNGDVGIGTSSPQFLLSLEETSDTNVLQLYDTDGNCRQNPESGSITTTCSSDERLKTNIADADSALDWLTDIRIREYTVIASGEQRVGVVAQELQAVHPEMVHMGDDGFLSVELPNPWRLVQGIQEVNTKLEERIGSNGAISIDTFGNIGIGTSTPSYKLHVLGDAAATSFVNISTKEEKKGIEYLDEARKEDILGKLKAIQIAEYRYNFESDDNPLRLGLIAEEAPSEVLSVSGKGVDIYKLATFTLASVQEIALKLETLEERIAALEAAGVVGTGGGVFSTTTLKSAFAELGVLIEKGFAQFDALAFKQLIAQKDNDGEAAAGVGTIYAGNKLVLVENSQIKASSKVFITFTSPVVGSWFITDKANGSFRVTLDQTQVTDVTFDYFIVQTERDQTPTSDTGVVDTEAPEITIIGANPYYIATGTTYVEPGVTITDNVDQNLTYTLSVNGYSAETHPLDTSVAGENVLTYKVLDTAGNLTTATRSVVVGADASLTSLNSGTSTPTTATTTPAVTETATTIPPVVEETPADTVAPIITLTGSAAIEINVGDSFTDEGAAATDDTDGDITANIAVSGTVDTTAAGLYTLTYAVSDIAGNESSVSRIVTVSAVESTEAPTEDVVE